MSNYEHCCECNERTGRAGASDDSLYLGSVGPFCEDCVNTWPDKMTEEYGRLMARVVVLEAVTAKVDEQDLRGITIKAEGEANFYVLLKGNSWLARVQMNGDYLVPQQEAILNALIAGQQTLSTRQRN